MSALSEYLVPYVVSNIVAVLLLIVAYLWPKVARWLFVGIFIAAGVLVLICVCAAALWYIDANYMWCTFFPFLSGC